jgi:hypothetical protein
MTFLARKDLVPCMIAASDIAVIPFGVDWPLHQALGFLSARDVATLERCFGSLDIQPSREHGAYSSALAASWTTAMGLEILEVEHRGLLARWRVVDGRLTGWRRTLMVAPPDVVRVLRHAGKRWAMASETVLKNLDTAAASWAPTSRGVIDDPTLRQASVLALR